MTLSGTTVSLPRRTLLALTRAYLHACHPGALRAPPAAPVRSTEATAGEQNLNKPFVSTGCCAIRSTTKTAAPDTHGRAAVHVHPVWPPLLQSDSIRLSSHAW